MIKVCAYWDCKIGSGPDLKRQLYQFYDFTAKAFGVDDLLLVDEDNSCTIDPPNLFDSIQKVRRKFSDLVSVFISVKGKTPLKDFKHPVNALYIVGKNYTGYNVPEGAESVRIETPGSVPLWAHVALGIVLMDRVHKE
jgi:predicted SpoU family rRNA methylase